MPNPQNAKTNNRYLHWPIIDCIAIGKPLHSFPLHNRKAMTTTNHARWEVQYYHQKNGWIKLSQTYTKKEEAETIMNQYKVTGPTIDLRVYESLKETK